MEPKNTAKEKKARNQNWIYIFSFVKKSHYKKYEEQINSSIIKIELLNRVFHI